jgi:hypothetical protein
MDNEPAKPDPDLPVVEFLLATIGNEKLPTVDRVDAAVTLLGYANRWKSRHEEMFDMIKDIKATLSTLALRDDENTSVAARIIAAKAVLS